MAALDRRRQAGRRPVAGQQRDCASASARPAAWHPPPAVRRKSRAVRARSARAAAARQCRRSRRPRARSRGQLLARRIQQPVGGADGDRQPVGKGEQPFHRAVDDAGIGGSPAAASTRKWALTMARNSVGAVKSGTSDVATMGGTARMTASPAPSAIRSAPKSSAVDAVRLESRMPRRRCAEDARRRRSRREAQRRIDEGAPKPVARDQRPAGAAAGDQRLADHRAGERGRALRRLGVEGGQQQRPDSRS